MKRLELVKSIKDMDYFEELSHNNTYTLLSFAALNDPGVYCKPGGQRAFLSLAFEHRDQNLKNGFKASVLLVPPYTSEYETDRKRAIQLIRQEKLKKANNYFITLINFNDLIRSAIDKGSSLKEILSELIKELEHLKTNGQPSRSWSRQNNLITDWSKLFQIAQRQSSIKE